MASATVKAKKTVPSKRRAKAKPMTKIEILQKIIADQKFIREAIQSGISFEELEQKHGFKFARLPRISNK
jgi:hypothetical protein